MSKRSLLTFLLTAVTVISCGTLSTAGENPLQPGAETLHRENCRRFSGDSSRSSAEWLNDAALLQSGEPTPEGNRKLFRILMLASSRCLVEGDENTAQEYAVRALMLDDQDEERSKGLKWYAELETWQTGRVLLLFHEKSRNLDKLYSSGDQSAYLSGVYDFYRLLIQAPSGFAGFSLYERHRIQGDLLLPKGERFYLFEPMRYMQGGTFLMGNGSPDSDPWEKPVRRVVLFNYFISPTEVSQKLYHEITGYNPAFKTQNPGCPVEEVSWYEAVIFCNLYSIRSGLTPCYDPSTGRCDFTASGYRLPTEAEWEYAARGGIQSTGTVWPGSDSCETVAWFHPDSGQITHPGGLKKANEAGLFDMGGNVWEWCQDWFGKYSEDDCFYPVGPAEGFEKVRRGGSWSSPAENCTVTARSYFIPITGYGNTGFRLVRTACHGRPAD